MLSSSALLPTTLVLSLRGIDVTRDGHPALHGVGAQVHAGQLLVVVGPNGSGKSTLLSVAAGLLPADGGIVEKRLHTRIALLPQSTALAPHLPLTVADVVAMGTWARLGSWRPSRRADREAIAEALAAVELTELARRPIGTLSGGQRQRALLAQVLVQRADLVLLDEPMSGLDARSRAIIAASITRLTEAGTAVIAVTHDPAEFASIDDMLELHDGRVRGRGAGVSSLPSSPRHAASDPA